MNSASLFVDPYFGDVIAFGKVISVPENAVRAHEAHGDTIFTSFQEIDEDFRNWLEVELFISLPNADCWFDVW